MTCSVASKDTVRAVISSLGRDKIGHTCRTLVFTSDLTVLSLPSHHACACRQIKSGMTRPRRPRPSHEFAHISRTHTHSLLRGLRGPILGRIGHHNHHLCTKAHAVRVFHICVKFHPLYSVPLGAHVAAHVAIIKTPMYLRLSLRAHSCTHAIFPVSIPSQL